MGVYIKKAVTPRLPSAYQEVEYIDMPQGSFINTKIYPNVYDICQYKANIISASNAQYRPVMSAYEHCYIAYACANAFGYWWKNWGGLTTTRWEFSLGNTYEILSYIKSGVAYAKNLSTELENVNTAISTSYASSTTPYAINGRANSGSTTTSMTISYPINNKIYYIQLWRGNNNGEKGTMVANFVPCYRKSDSKCGLYDLERNEFFENKGSGTITCGDDVVINALQPISISISPLAQKCKIWNITLDSDMTSTGNLISGDNDVANHFADDSACVLWRKISSIEDKISIVYTFSGNKKLMPSQNIYQQRMQKASTSWGPANGGQQLKYSSGTKENHATYADSSGNIFVTISNRPLQAGNYQVIFFW